jgi:dihydrofolate reductase
MMKKVVYYVAISIDGFICGLDADISGFVGEGNGITQYIDDLKKFENVIMGRNAYEFGYVYGLIPG